MCTLVIVIVIYTVVLIPSSLGIKLIRRRFPFRFIENESLTIKSVLYKRQIDSTFPHIMPFNPNKCTTALFYILSIAYSAFSFHSAAIIFVWPLKNRNIKPRFPFRSSILISNVSQNIRWEDNETINRISLCMCLNFGLQIWKTVIEILDHWVVT